MGARRRRGLHCCRIRCLFTNSLSHSSGTGTGEFAWARLPISLHHMVIVSRMVDTTSRIVRTTWTEVVIWQWMFALNVEVAVPMAVRPLAVVKRIAKAKSLTKHLMGIAVRTALAG